RKLRPSTTSGPLPCIAAVSRPTCSCSSGRSRKSRVQWKLPHDRSRMRAAVVALGDLGRSARMLYHARALAASGVEVDLVGFEGTPVPKTIGGDPRISIHRLNPATLRRGAFSGSSYAGGGLLAATRQGFRLWRGLRRLPQPNLVLVQNPPAFPTLLVTWFSLRRRGVRFA